MNFKLLTLLLFICSSCGVKGPPKAPAGTAVPSFLDSYLGKNKVDSKKVKSETEDTSESDKEE